MHQYTVYTSIPLTINLEAFEDAEISLDVFVPVTLVYDRATRELQWHEADHQGAHIRFADGQEPVEMARTCAAPILATDEYQTRVQDAFDAAIDGWKVLS